MQLFDTGGSHVHIGDKTLRFLTDVVHDTTAYRNAILP